jgi:hypothetical protein
VTRESIGTIINKKNVRVVTDIVDAWAADEIGEGEDTENPPEETEEIP